MQHPIVISSATMDIRHKLLQIPTLKMCSVPIKTIMVQETMHMLHPSVQSCTHGYVKHVCNLALETKYLAIYLTCCVTFMCKKQNKMVFLFFVMLMCYTFNAQRCFN